MADPPQNNDRDDPNGVRPAPSSTLKLSDLRQWDVVTGWYSHEAPGTGKPRPLLLISSDAEIAAGTLRVMKVSKQTYKGVPVMSIDRVADGPEFTCTGLHHSPSYVHVTSVQQTDLLRIYKRIGKLGTQKVQHLLQIVAAAVRAATRAAASKDR